MWVFFLFIPALFSLECVWHNRADIKWREGLNDIKNWHFLLAGPDPERDVATVALYERRYIFSEIWRHILPLTSVLPLCVRASMWVRASVRLRAPRGVDWLIHSFIQLRRENQAADGRKPGRLAATYAASRTKPLTTHNGKSTHTHRDGKSNTKLQFT